MIVMILIFLVFITIAFCVVEEELRAKNMRHCILCGEFKATKDKPACKECEKFMDDLKKGKL